MSGVNAQHGAVSDTGTGSPAIKFETTDERTYGDLSRDVVSQAEDGTQEHIAHGLAIDDSASGVTAASTIVPELFSLSDGVSYTSLHVDSQECDSGSETRSVLSSTASARPSVYNFIEENGRKYHRFRQGRYKLPNDEIEQDRLDLQHHLFLITLGELYLAPIKNLEGGLDNVLDIATGTGIWAIDFANRFHYTEVIGMDLSPIQPEFVPPNCHFEVDDAEDNWLYSHQFDYIHGRALAACFRSHRRVVESAFHFTRPGGYLELQDIALPFLCIDDTMAGSAFEKWLSTTIEGAAALGEDWTQVPRYKEYLLEAGFEDVVERRFTWPLGTWARGEKAKVLGSWFREDVMSALQAVSMAVMTRGLGMKTEEIELLLMGARNDINSGRLHVYANVFVVYGRKPTASNSA